MRGIWLIDLFNAYLAEVQREGGFHVERCQHNAIPITKHTFALRSHMAHGADECST
jgi:hypothetical protein